MSRAIFFDLDGTLTDSGPGIINCAQLALAHFGIQVPDRDQLRVFVGPPLRQSFARFGVPPASLDEAIARFRARYVPIGKFENTPYPGIAGLLDRLQGAGYRLFVATSKPQVTAQEVLEAAEQKVYAIRRGRSAQNMVPVSMVLEDVMAHLAELTASGGKTLPGLSTGLSAVDAKINGLNKSDLLLLAARPGMGKTSMALNVALSAARESGKTVAIFSLEMSKEQLVTRLIASEGLVENTRLVTGNLRESDWQRIAEAASSLSRMDIRIDDNPLLTVADMNAKCRRLDNLGLVVIDYLQLMTSAGGKGYSGENRQQAVSDISRMLKIMAKELQVPVLCLSQLSRANEKRDDKRPMLSDLRESGAIEQDADIVLFLYRDDYYNSDSEKRNVAECIVAKNRHGETGKVELRWMPEYTAFGTLENRYDDEE